MTPDALEICQAVVKDPLELEGRSSTSGKSLSSYGRWQPQLDMRTFFVKTAWDMLIVIDKGTRWLSHISEIQLWSTLELMEWQCNLLKQIPPKHSSRSNIKNYLHFLLDYLSRENYRWTPVSDNFHLCLRSFLNAFRRCTCIKWGIRLNFASWIWQFYKNITISKQFRLKIDSLKRTIELNIPTALRGQQLLVIIGRNYCCKTQHYLLVF